MLGVDEIQAVGGGRLVRLLLPVERDRAARGLSGPKLSARKTEEELVAGD